MHFFINPSSSFAQIVNPNYNTDVRGGVQSIGDDGSIFLTNSETEPFHHFKLWGLEVTDVQELRRFLIGRLLECKIVHFRELLPVADCLIHPQLNGQTVYRPLSNANGPVPRGPISVFDWAADLGFSDQGCKPYSNHDYISDGVEHSWYCSKDGKPDYGTFSYGNLP